MIARPERPIPVLVADDSRLARRTLGEILTANGFSVTFACEGLEAERLALDPAGPLLMLLDWEMPGRDGPTILRRVREDLQRRNAYAILVTARECEDAVIEGLESGADDFVRKPFRAAELLARVRAGVRVLRLQGELAAHVERLESALAEVHTLRGLIPICMHCHRIRTESDHWERLERYIEAHADVEFSHGLCEECLQLHYPETGGPGTEDAA